jgi:cytochrome c5
MTRQIPSLKRAMLLTTTLLVALGVSGCSDDAPAELNAEQRAALVERIKPVVSLNDLVSKQEAQVVAAPAPAVATEAAPVEAPASASADAKGLYDAKCMMCHTTGAAGAPMLGDAAAWEPRTANGVDALVASARTGKGAMPPNGGSAFSEDEMRQVIEYMLAEAGLL